MKFTKLFRRNETSSRINQWLHTGTELNNQKLKIPAIEWHKETTNLGDKLINHNIYNDKEIMRF